MSDTTVAETPAAEPKLGKPKLAKAKERKPVDPNAPPGEKRTPIPRVSPFAGKRIFLNRANEAIGAEGKNPKRPGSNGFNAFSMYEDGITVEAQLEKWKTTMVKTKSGKDKPVGDMADIRWDKDHGFIELRDAS
jgi:hypothetical protein